MKKFVCSMALFLAASAFAQERRAVPNSSFASDFQTIPVVANTTGNGGATFQTYAAILNPTASPIVIDATLYDPSGFARNRVINLAAGELKTYSNFLSDVFNFTGGGAVTLRTGAASRFIVSTEVRTGTGGRYSTPVPSLEFAGSSSRSFSPGITVDSNSRTNVGCFNQSDATNVVTARVFDNTGTQQLGTATLNLGPKAWGQTAVTAVVSGGFVRFEPQEAAVCYAVVVDNVTNDGRFISAAEYQP